MRFELDFDHLSYSGVPIDVDDLRLGVSMGLIAPRTAIAVAERAVVAGSEDPTLLALASMSAHHIADVREALGAVDPEDAVLEPESSVRKWLYLQLRAAYGLRDLLSDPFGAVESIYADFGYPPIVAPFVRYMPAQLGEPTGEAALHARWWSYLESEEGELSSNRRELFRGWLVIESDQLELEDITAAMGREPHTGHKRGGASQPSRRRRIDASWQLALAWPKGRHAGTDGLGHAIETLGPETAERAGALAARGCVVTLSVCQELTAASETKGIHLDPATVRWVATAGASIDIDQYVFDLEEDEDACG